MPVSIALMPNLLPCTMLGGTALEEGCTLIQSPVTKTLAGWFPVDQFRLCACHLL